MITSKIEPRILTTEELVDHFEILELQDKEGSVPKKKETNTAFSKPSSKAAPK